MTVRGWLSRSGVGSYLPARRSVRGGGPASRATIVGPLMAAEIEDPVAGAELPLAREEVQRVERPYLPKPVKGHL